VPVFRLGREPVFPDPERAEPEGLLAVGGDLAPRRLLTAYAMGIFPWYEDGQPILWWSPSPRLVLFPKELHVGRSVRKVMNAGRFDVRCDTAFARVIDRCAEKARPGQDGTWITDEMRAAYVGLHEAGFAHSIEAWEDGELAGGLYGVSLGGAFFGESMFADRDDASKVAFVTIVQQLARWEFDVIDCQVKTDHLERFGAREVPRAEFLSLLQRSVVKPTRRGPWRLDG
jgi:leucyl/phenylalanyl-tRNA--protein transferase